MNGFVKNTCDLYSCVSWMWEISGSYHVITHLELMTLLQNLEQCWFPVTCVKNLNMFEV